MKISRETDYAIRCLLHMARDPGGTHTVREISAPQEIPVSFLGKILQKLGRAGITTSARGARGGFRLALHPAKITLLSVIEAVEGPLAPNDCPFEGKSCSRAKRCAVHPVWKEIREEIAGRLRRVTVRNLVKTEDAMILREFGMTGEGT